MGFDPRTPGSRPEPSRCPTPEPPRHPQATDLNSYFLISIPANFRDFWSKRSIMFFWSVFLRFNLSIRYKRGCWHLLCIWLADVRIDQAIWKSTVRLLLAFTAAFTARKVSPNASFNFTVSLLLLNRQLLWQFPTAYCKHVGRVVATTLLYLVGWGCFNVSTKNCC